MKRFNSLVQLLVISLVIAACNTESKEEGKEGADFLNGGWNITEVTCGSRHHTGVVQTLIFDTSTTQKTADFDYNKDEIKLRGGYFVTVGIQLKTNYVVNQNTKTISFTNINVDGMYKDLSSMIPGDRLDIARDLELVLPTRHRTSEISYTYSGTDTNVVLESNNDDFYFCGDEATDTATQSKIFLSKIKAP